MYHIVTWYSFYGKRKYCGGRVNTLLQPPKWKCGKSTIGPRKDSNRIQGEQQSNPGRTQSNLNVNRSRFAQIGHRYAQTGVNESEKKYDSSKISASDTRSFLVVTSERDRIPAIIHTAAWFFAIICIFSADNAVLYDKYQLCCAVILRRGVALSKRQYPFCGGDG